MIMIMTILMINDDDDDDDDEKIRLSLVVERKECDQNIDLQIRCCSAL